MNVVARLVLAWLWALSWLPLGLQAAIGRAEAAARDLQCDAAELQLNPTDDDIAALQADGYLGELIAELRAEQAAETPDARTARDALALLTAALSGRAPAANTQSGG